MHNALWHRSACFTDRGGFASIAVRNANRYYQILQYCDNVLPTKGEAEERERERARERETEK